MRLLFENKDLRCFYKESGEHTLKTSNSVKDESMCLYRLDYCTSGIVVCAKNKTVFDTIKQLQQKDMIIKTYVSRVQNSKVLSKFNCPFKIETYFRPYKEGRIKVKPVQEKEFKKYKNKDVTERKYISTVINTDDDNVTVQITRGFRHQIRSHLSFLGCPIIGDTLYGYNGLEDKKPERIELVCQGIIIPGIFEYSL